jgi:hypothetical protein
MKVFSASPIRTFKNIVTNEKVDSRAFNWAKNEPIMAGNERMYPEKEFVYTPIAATVAFQYIFKKYGLEKIAEMLRNKTGVDFKTEDFANELQTEINRGQRKILIMTKAWTLCRATCSDNRLILWTGEKFLMEDCILDDDPQSWNVRLKKSNWRLLKD